MTAALDLVTARARAESLMTSTCTIRARDGVDVTDPVTGEVTPSTGTLVYSGKCRVRPAGPAGWDVNAGGAELARFDYVVSIPFAATAVKEGERVAVDSSPDPALVGVTVEIRKVDRGEHITARRLSCEEVV